MKKVCLALILVALVLAGISCDGKTSLEYDERIETRQEYGEPEDTTTYSTDDYWTETWWYWSKGIAFTFEKSERTDSVLGCARHTKEYINLKSTYLFEPIEN